MLAIQLPVRHRLHHVNQTWHLLIYDFANHGTTRSQFDPDIKSLIRIKIVHGSWRNDDANGIGIEQGARKYPNIQNIKAYLPEPYGTHHSKMITLFRHDDLAQVIITTGNFIEKDWSMSQAFWCSPLLTFSKGEPKDDATTISRLPTLGSGERFKHDLLAYFSSYGTRLSDLTSQLRKYDFSHVRGALIASVPGTQNLRSTDPEKENLWGLPAMKRLLSQIPCVDNGRPHIVTQVSSVASFGDDWLKNTFFTTLSTSKTPLTQTSQSASQKPKHSLIFPTASEIRNSIDGYFSGSSIHMKTQTPAQAKQLEYLQPLLCHWAPLPCPLFKPSSSIFNTLHHRSPAPAAPLHSPIQCKVKATKANRHPAAPHIKTYIRFSSSPSSSPSSPSSKAPTTQPTIDWALLTSANLSTQAWGTASNASGEVKICSYEVGICFWGGLWGDDDNNNNNNNDENHEDSDRNTDGQRRSQAEGAAKMIPVFSSNTPDAKDVEALVLREEERSSSTLIGWRMPYDLPLIPYQAGERPWCASSSYRERDWMGKAWKGRG